MLMQLIDGMGEIKLATCEMERRWEWERIQARLFRVTERRLQIAQVQQAGSLSINELKNIVITFLAAHEVIGGGMSLGMMLAVQYIIGQLNSPVNEFIAFSRDWQDARLSLVRINEIHELKNEEDTLGGNTYSTPDSSSIIIENLTFHYEGPNSPKVLDDIHLIIPEGKVTAIVGASGSGKTTLIKVLLKFYELTKGSVSVGGFDLKLISARAWRGQCGVVMQDGYIFSDTILKNIVLSEETYSEERVLHAVTVANIKDFVESLPLRYNTKIGNNGIGLSQGQKQRLLIARAVYRNPNFFLLDEATSALDANNERAIIGKLGEFFQGRTVIVVAHRLSTVKNADQIVVLDKGRIVEVGTHHDLTKARGAYYELVKNQLELGN